MPWELGKPRKNLINLVENGRIQPGSALDLCCGIGTNTAYMAQEGFDVIAIDISKHALKLAKQKARKANDEIKFVLASFVTLPFRDTAFDFVFDMGCFHHVEVEDRPAFIQGVKRILKPDSKYMLICFSDRNGQRGITSPRNKSSNTSLGNSNCWILTTSDLWKATVIRGSSTAS